MQLDTEKAHKVAAYNNIYHMLSCETVKYEYVAMKIISFSQPKMVCNIGFDEKQ